MKYMSYVETVKHIKRYIEAIKEANKPNVLVSITVFANPSIGNVKFEDGSEISVKEFLDKVSGHTNTKIDLMMFDSIPEDKGLIIVPYVDDRDIIFRTDDIKVEVDRDTLQGYIIKPSDI